MIALLAYPRSGSSLTTLLLCLATKSRTKHIGNPSCPMVKKGFIEPYDKEGLTKFHYPNDCGWTIGGDYDKLILLHRDPIENILSWLYSSNNRKDSPEDITKFTNRVCNSAAIEMEIQRYKSNVDFYTNSTKAKKIIRYENITIDAAKELYSIKDFIGTDDETIEQIRIKEKELKNKMLDFKDDMFMLNTKGTDHNKFKNTLTNENLNMMQEKLQGYFYEDL